MKRPSCLHRTFDPLALARGFTPAESDEDQGDSLNRQRLGSIVRGLEGDSMLVRKLAQSLKRSQDGRRSLLDVPKYAPSRDNVKGIFCSSK